MRRSSVKPGASGGFTLLELLIALVILAIMLSMVLSSLQFVSDSSTRIELTADKNDHYSRVQSFLRRQLTQIDPNIVAARSGNRDAAPLFSASADRLEFLAQLSARSAEQGLHHIVLQVEKTGFGEAERQQLVLESTALAGPPIASRQVLLPHETSIRWEYFTVGANGRAAWTDEWDGAFSTPTLIRLEVGSANESAHWSEFIVAPRINAKGPAND